MSNLLSNIHVGSTGLRVASAGINVTSHNVANATTEGFSRRDVNAITRQPTSRRGHLYGEGAQVALLGRSADRLVDDHMVTVIGEESRSAVAYQTLAAVEGYFDEESVSGPSTLLREFFDSLSEMTADPSDTSLRHQVVNSGERLTNAVTHTAEALSRAQDLIQDELEDTVSVVNDKLEQVAALNERVMAGGGGVAAGDYADQRDELIRELAEDVGATVQFSGEGVATVFIGSHAAVSKGHAREITVTTDASGAPQINLSAGSAAAVLNVTDDLGGKFGGLNDAWTAAESYSSDLDTWVDGMATAFNTQHQAGFDAAGAAGGDFFSFTAGAEATTLAIDANLLADVTLFAAAANATAAAGDDGNLDLLIAEEAALNHAGGTRTSGQALAEIYGDLGRDVTNYEMQNDTHQGELFDMAELRQAISGVDLDEEAANLMQWQAAYEASARVISTTNQLIDTLMAMGT